MVLKNRLGKHSKNQAAIQNGRLLYLPGMSHLSTSRSVEQCVQDLWLQLEGNAMLELNFSNVLTAVSRFQRAINEKVAGTSSGKSELKNYLVKLFLGTVEHRHACIVQNVANECMEVLRSDHSRNMSKREVVRHLVSCFDLKAFLTAYF